MSASLLSRSLRTVAPRTSRLLTVVSNRSYATAAKVNTFEKDLQTQLEEIKKNGLYKNERIITSPQNHAITVKGKKVLNFCANNYLGLSDNPDLIAKSKSTMDSHGLGLSSVRFICGTQDIHKTLEQKIAQFHGKEDCILYGSCFDANGGLFEALLTPNDAIISDQLNHASIIDGIRLAKAQKYRYKHNDMKDLEAKLIEAKGARVRMIVTDGAFSMDGVVANLKEIAALADKYDAIIMIDECHSTGFLGRTGRGSYEYSGVPVERIDIINSTLGKALGGATGGYTTASKNVVDMLRQRSRPYLFSNTLAPSIVGPGIDTFDILMKSTALRDKLEDNTKRFRTKIAKAGFKTKGVDHPIVPIMLGDAQLAGKFAEEMLERGIYVVGFSYPVVPMGEARIRVQLSAAHTSNDIDTAVEAFTEVGKKLNVIS